MGVFSEIKPVNQARKNPFDLSCYSTYNTKCGMILPLKFWPTLPSSKYEIDLKALMRTQPLQTAAFAGFSINYDVVWTPNNDHYSSFNQFIAQRLNKQHTTQPDIDFIPSFRLYDLLPPLLYGSFLDMLSSEVSQSDRVYYRNSQDFSITLPYQQYICYAEHSPNESMFLGAIRSLDLLEYGNYLPVVKAMRQAFKAFVDTWTYEVSSQGELPLYVKLGAFVGGFVTNEDSVWLMEDISESSLLGSPYATIITDIKALFDDYLDDYVNLSNLLPTDDMYYSLWPVMCYNKAFWQFYRNEYYDIDYQFYLNCESTYYKLPYVMLFNFDDYDQDFSVDGYSLNEGFRRLLAMLAVKPHQYKKDLFTGLLPSTQYGSVSVAATDSDFHRLIGNVHDSTSNLLVNGQVYSAGSNNMVVNRGSGTTGTVSEKYKFDPSLSISVLELRKADSLQRFKERMLRAGNRTKDIFKAHGWDEPYSEKAFDVQFLGTFDGRLDLNVVASTTDTENVNLGQLASNGIGAIGGNKITFESHDFGTLMVVAYITKDAIYDSYGVNKAHTLLEAFDFPYPELQNVSLSPITEDQLVIYGRSGSYDNNKTVLGYLPQNMAYKTASDFVHGEFFSVNPLDNQRTLKVPTPIGIFANMVTPRLDIFNNKSLSFFYIQPDCADNVFVVNADGTQETDQFFANVRFDLKCVQPLDVIGLPI